ncbi:MAG: hypothetical protein RL417_188 [Pseudomonadota bacterium]|jgi:hypothetical protein
MAFSVKRFVFPQRLKSTEGSVEFPDSLNPQTVPATAVHQIAYRLKSERSARLSPPAHQCLLRYERSDTDFKVAGRTLHLQLEE